MELNAVKSRIRAWLVHLFIQSIEKISKEEDRQEVIQWLNLSRDTLNSDLTKKEKFVQLYGLIDTRKTAAIVCSGVVETVKNYKKSDLPLAVKISVPLTLLAVPFVGGHGAGVVALGSAIGLPVLLLVFLGSAGITSVLECFVRHKEARPYLYDVLELIARDELTRRTSAALRSAMCDDPVDSRRFDMPREGLELRDRLLGMDPFDFELHVVSFFKASGIKAWATKKSNDLGVDGFAEHSEGMIVIQCKRYGPDNPIGSPDIRHFKGVVEENGAWKGYFVTTSRFTEGAQESARMSAKLVLIDMDELIKWHDAMPIL